MIELYCKYLSVRCSHLKTSDIAAVSSKEFRDIQAIIFGLFSVQLSDAVLTVFKEKVPFYRNAVTKCVF